MKTQRTKIEKAGQRCPWCDDLVTELSGTMEDSPGLPGNFLICEKCAGLCKIDDASNIVKQTVAEQFAVMMFPGVLEMQDIFKNLARARRRGREYYTYYLIRYQPKLLGNALRN